MCLSPKPLRVENVNSLSHPASVGVWMWALAGTGPVGPGCCGADSGTGPPGEGGQVLRTSEGFTKDGDNRPLYLRVFKGGIPACHKLSFSDADDFLLLLEVIICTQE